METLKKYFALAAVIVGALSLLALAACSPVQPTPLPSPTTSSSNSCVISGNGNGNVCNVGNVAPTPAPSSSPASGPFAKPDYVKITQFGETCGNDKNGVPVLPSGQDRSVRIGCNKALTLSPKCHQPNGGPDVDCPVPDGAAPDSFEIVDGAEHVVFSLFTESQLASMGLKASSAAFNRRATGVSEGAVKITGSYAGIRVQEDFILTVVK